VDFDDGFKVRPAVVATVRQPGDLTLEDMKKIAADIELSSRAETVTETYDPRSGTTTVVETAADGQVLRRFERPDLDLDVVAFKIASAGVWNSRFSSATSGSLASQPDYLERFGTDREGAPAPPVRKRPELRVAETPAGRAAPSLGEETV